jgi:hypothetical protein
VTDEGCSVRIFSVLELLIAAEVAFQRVASRSLRVGQAQLAFRSGVEAEDQADILEVVVYNPPAGHLGEMVHSRLGAHILQEVGLDQAGNVLAGVHSLQVGGLPVGLELIVN